MGESLVTNTASQKKGGMHAHGKGDQVRNQKIWMSDVEKTDSAATGGGSWGRATRNAEKKRLSVQAGNSGEYMSRKIGPLIAGRVRENGRRIRRGRGTEKGVILLLAGASRMKRTALQSRGASNTLAGGPRRKEVAVGWFYLKKQMKCSCTVSG